MTRSRKIKLHGKNLEDEVQEVDCGNPCPPGICPTVKRMTRITFALPDCSMIKVKMLQTTNAARWNLTTSIQRPPQSDISAIALVRYT